MEINTLSILNHWLTTLSRELSIPSLSFNSKGVCTFLYGENVECSIECPPGTHLVYFYAPMATLSDQGEEAFLRELMKANCFGLETHGATFAIDAEKNRILLCYTQPLVAIDASLFQRIFIRFVETAAEWKNRVDLLRQPSALLSKSI